MIESMIAAHLELQKTMVPAEASPASLAEAVNTLASFLAHETVRNPSEELELRRWITIERQHPSPGFYQPVDVVVLCASAVLCAAETVLSAFAEYVQSTGAVQPPPNMPLGLVFDIIVDSWSSSIRP